MHTLLWKFLLPVNVFWGSNLVLNCSVFWNVTPCSHVYVYSFSKEPAAFIIRVDAWN